MSYSGIEAKDVKKILATMKEENSDYARIPPEVVLIENKIPDMMKARETKFYSTNPNKQQIEQFNKETQQLLIELQELESNLYFEIIEQKYGVGQTALRQIALRSPTLTYYNYCGPGTKIEYNLKHNVPPVNKVDEYCRLHDIQYATATNPLDVRRYDEQLISNVQKVIDENVDPEQITGAYDVQIFIKGKNILENQGLDPMMIVGVQSLTPERRQKIIDDLNNKISTYSIAMSQGASKLPKIPTKGRAQISYVREHDNLLEYNHETLQAITEPNLRILLETFRERLNGFAEHNNYNATQTQDLLTKYNLVHLPKASALKPEVQTAVYALRSRMEQNENEVNNIFSQTGEVLQSETQQVEEAQQIEAKPMAAKPVGAKPMAAKPVGAKPAGAKPAEKNIEAEIVATPPQELTPEQVMSYNQLLSLYVINRGKLLQLYKTEFGNEKDIRDLINKTMTSLETNKGNQQAIKNFDEQFKLIYDKYNNNRQYYEPTEAKEKFEVVLNILDNMASSPILPNGQLNRLTADDFRFLIPYSDQQPAEPKIEPPKEPDAKGSSNAIGGVKQEAKPLSPVAPDQALRPEDKQAGGIPDVPVFAPTPVVFEPAVALPKAGPEDSVGGVTAPISTQDKTEVAISGGTLVADANKSTGVNTFTRDNRPFYKILGGAAFERPKQQQYDNLCALNRFHWIVGKENDMRPDQNQTNQLIRGIQENNQMRYSNPMFVPSIPKQKPELDTGLAKKMKVSLERNMAKQTLRENVNLRALPSLKKHLRMNRVELMKDKQTPEEIREIYDNTLSFPDIVRYDGGKEQFV